MKIGLSDDEMARIRAALEAVPAVEKAVLFGSRAMGLARSNSDVDILLYGYALQTRDVLLVASLLDATTLPYQFDLIRHDANNASLLEHVREYGNVIFQRQETASRSKPSRKSAGIASEWTIATIDEVSDKVAMGPFGSSIKVNTFVHDGIPIISGQHLHGSLVDDRPGFNFISEEHAERLRNANVQRGDVIFTHAGNIGQVAYIPTSSKYDRYVISQRQFYMRCNPKRILPEFVVAFFKSPDGRHKLLANTSQTGVPSIARPVSYLRTIEIPIPPIEEQRAIAHILGTLDDKIKLNRRMNETLESMARALFKAWFVDFEPVRAKMTGRWRRGQSLPGLPAHLYDLFPDRLVDSELGEIPEGWKIGTLGDVAEHPRRSIQPSEIAFETSYIALEHMPKRCIALTEWGVANGLESNKYEFKRGEILFGKLRPYFHKVGIAPVDGVCSTDIVVIAPKANLWFGFILGHVSSDAFVEFTNAGSTGTKMPRTSWSEMSRYEVVFPPAAISIAFNEYMQTMTEMIITKVHESKSLTDLRDALLPKLISGDLRVPDAERIAARQ